MNPTKHTPWSCRFIRFAASLSRADGAPRWAQRHLAHCPSCQQHYAAAATLDGALRASARAVAAVPRASLEPDIMREILAAAPAPRIAPRPRRVWPTLAVAASAACAVALVFIQRPQPSVRPHAVGATVATQPVAASNGAQPVAWSQLATPVRTLLNEDPLQSEARQVYAEARSAVDFLALNFLPNPPGTEKDASL